MVYVEVIAQDSQLPADVRASIATTANVYRFEQYKQQ
jgi:hypothetical protein